MHSQSETSILKIPPALCGWGLSCAFPALGTAICFPATTTRVTSFPAFGTGCLFSRLCHSGYAVGQNEIQV